MTIEIKNLTKSFDRLKVFEAFSLSIQTNSITGIMGPSGCGKTTLLSLIAGLSTADKGSITGVDYNGLSCVFQEDNLIPWKTVAENLQFVAPHSTDAQIDTLLAQLHLTDYRDAYPKELSGGMRQRVSIARAFIYPSTLLLMDEPFTGIDFTLKEKLIDDFHDLWHTKPKTVIVISHDESDIRRLCHRKIVLGDVKPTQIVEDITFRV